MTQEEFYERTICKPWRKNADGPDYYDCWGLIVAYFRDVLRIELNMYDHGSIVDGFLSEIESGKWSESETGVVFMAFRNGTPEHCGLAFGKRVLHSSGADGMGQVTCHPMRVIKKMFKDVRVYEFN